MPQTYADLFAQVMQHYHSQDFAGALELLTQEGPGFPEEGQMVYYLRSCMAARIDQPEQAIRIIQEALDNGFWYGERTMRDTPSWQSLQGLPAYESLVEIGQQRQAEAQTGPELFILEPLREEPYPLLMTLHGNGDNGQASLTGWRSARESGWLVAAAQSSQMEGNNVYIWDDQSTALQEVETNFNELNTRYIINPKQVIIAGFSMGGETALRAILTGVIPATGFILLGPGGPTTDDPAAWLPLLKANKDKNLRGYIFFGEADQAIPHLAISTLVDLLNDNNIACKLETIPNLSHQYPPDFGPALERALNFVIGKD